MNCGVYQPPKIPHACREQIGDLLQSALMNDATCKTWKLSKTPRPSRRCWLVADRQFPKQVLEEGDGLHVHCGGLSWWTMKHKQLSNTSSAINTWILLYCFLVLNSVALIIKVIRLKKFLYWHNPTTPQIRPDPGLLFALKKEVIKFCLWK